MSHTRTMQYRGHTITKSAGVAVHTPRRNRYGIPTGGDTVSHRTLWQVTEDGNVDWLGQWFDTRRDAVAWVDAQF